MTEGLLPEQQEQLGALQGEDRRRGEEIVRRFAAIPDDASRRGELWQAREGAFSLEKKALPVISAELRARCQPQALLSSVGLSVEPVVLTLLSLQPRVAYLLHTEVSRATALEVEADPEVRGCPAGKCCPGLLQGFISPRGLGMLGA